MFQIKVLSSNSKEKVKIAGRNINNLRYADDTTLMPEDTQAVCEEAYMGLLVSLIKSRTILPTMRVCHLNQSSISNRAFG